MTKEACKGEQRRIFRILELRTNVELQIQRE